MENAATAATAASSFVPAVRRREVRTSEVRSPEVPDLYALSAPATHFTGDFYHFTTRRDGTWFAVGDVTGHGLDSAIFMAMIQELLEERLADDAIRRPAQAVASIHQALAPELPVQRFVSLVLGHLAADGTLRLTNAGHCPPLMLRLDGEIAKVPAHGPILNVLVPPGWTESSFRLKVGEKIVLYTDGVFEASSPTGEELGVDGVARSVAGGGHDARAVAGLLVDEVERFSAGAPLHDDLTVMVVGRS